MMLSRLRPRVLVAVLLTAMVPLAIATSQGYHCAREAVLALVESHLNSLLQSQQNLVTQWIIQRERELQLLARSEALASGIFSNGNPEQMAGSLTATEREVMETFDAVSVTRTDGTVIHIKTASSVMDSPIPPEESGRVAQFEAKVLSKKGEEVGKLAAVESLQQGLIPILERSIDPSATVHLLPSPGVMVSVGSPRRQRVSEAQVNEALHAPLQQDDMSGYFIHSHREPKLLAAVRLVDSDWVIGAELDPDEALHWLDVLIWRAIWMAGATLILVVLISLWISGTLARPLRSMAEVADKIRGGDREASFHPSSIDEIEEVQQAITQMLQELRQKERQLIQAGALAVVGELTSRVVHEMRNPLSSIKLNLQAFVRQAKGDVVTLELTHIALQQVDRLERMFTELLQYGRPIELQPVATTFGLLLEESLRGVDPVAEEKGIRIEHEDRTLGISIEIDPEQIRRVLTNLLENAIQASPSGAIVRVIASVKHGTSSRLVIVVQDQGSGFTEEAKKSLFKPFFTTKPGGVGLGLANVRKVVGLHGGVISATPGESGGAVFRLELPLRQSSLQPEPALLTGAVTA